MLKGKQLGAAIAVALDRLGWSTKATAAHFGVRSPSVSGWKRYGRISKANFEKLKRLTADMLGPEHWGLPPERIGEVDATMELKRAAERLAADWMQLNDNARKAVRDLLDNLLEVHRKFPQMREASSESKAVRQVGPPSHHK